MSQLSGYSIPQRLLIGLGGLLIAATWLYLVLVRPTDWDSVGGSTEALITLGGYVGGTILLLIGVLPNLPARTIAIIPVALILNILIGQVVGSIGVPLYLDAVGTVLVAALAGPRAGLATGALSSVVWALFNPLALPFAAGSALTGWLAGVAIHRGGFRNIFLALLSGAMIGLVTGAVAAPVAAFVYGGTAGVGTGAMVSLFREMGNSLIASVTWQSFISDPLDKAIVLALVFLVVKTLPRKTRRALAPKVVSAE
ncbi:ECF transporter S component [Corynebacterium sp. A21]|uniref:ECF transporter S component n=1 Tax=Corynebacterium sp. A21 TaxID=3457318 RepID=UPI003FD342D6